MSDKEKIAAGLRACKNAPDYFVYICDSEEVYDKPRLLGIEVLFCRPIAYLPIGNSDLNFIPVWKDESNVENSYLFERAYDDY